MDINKSTATGHFRVQNLDELQSSGLIQVAFNLPKKEKNQVLNGMPV